MLKFRWMPVAIVIICAGLVQADWPNLRGPNHDGISTEKGLKTTWTKPLSLVWDRTVGDSFSSFACVGDRIYTCGTKDDQQVLLCLGATDGKEIWSRIIEKQYRDPQGGDGTRGTPTVSDGRVYVQGGHGKLMCNDAKTGKPIWSKSYDAPPRWGYSGSILIEGRLAIASVGGAGGALVAFDRKTGKEVWKCGDDLVGYSTPYPFTFKGKRYVVGFMGKTVIIADMTSGRLVFRMPWKTDYDINVAAPIFHDGHLFLSSGYRTGCALLKLRVEGDKLASTTVWQSKVLMNKFKSCILYQGNLYASDQSALLCVDFMTGKERWRQPRIGQRLAKHGNLLLAGGQFILLTQDGKLLMAKATPDGFSPTAQADILTGRCWTQPVVHQGKLYARNLERIVCFDLSG